MSNLSHRFVVTITRHLEAVGPKRLAHAADTDLTTVYRWARGTIATPEKLGDLERAIPGFISELFGLDHAAYFWITSPGEIHPSPSGLDGGARIYLRLGDNVAGDAAAAFRRNLGSISVSARGAEVEICYHERAIAKEAAAACSQWLAGKQVVARRRVDLEDQDGSARTVEMAPEVPEEAGRALILAAKMAQLPAARPWRVDRLSTDLIFDPRAQAIARIWSSQPSDPLDALGRAGLLPWCSIIQSRDGVLHGVRTGNGVPLKPDAKSTMIGPMRSCPDVRYIQVLEHNVPETLSEGLTFRRVRGTFLGQPVDYLQSAIGVGDTYLSCSTEMKEAA